MTKTIVGLYDDIDDARKAVEDLANSGYARDDISLLAADPDGEYGRQLGSYETVEAGNEAGSGAATGAIAGGVLGGLGGILLGLGALAIPGVGPIVAAGPIAAGLVGAGIGAATGGLVGALIGWGIPEEEAEYYTEGIRRGGTLVAVKTPDNKIDNVSSILGKYGPIDIDERAEMWRADGWTGYDADAEPYTTEQITTERERYQKIASGEEALPIVEEELRVGKRTVGKEGIRVRSYMVETPVEEKVSLREEEIHVERRPVNKAVDPADVDAFEEATFEVTAAEEEVVVDKKARVKEEVIVGKEVRERTETVKDTVRHTEVDIDKTGATVNAFATYNDDFRLHHRNNFADTGYDYDVYEPAYRYGYTVASDERYNGRDWVDIEPEIRKDWESKYGTDDKSAWDKMKDSIQHAWNSVRGKTYA